jgi:DUF1009 family protein
MPRDELEELVEEFFAKLTPLIDLAAEAQVATAIKDSMIAADFAGKAGQLDIHQAMITRARRLLGIPNA